MNPLLASEFLGPEQVVIMLFVLFVLPGVSLVSLIANWLIRRWWVASLIGPLVCLVILVWLTLSYQYQTAAKRDRDMVRITMPLVLLSVLPSFGIGVVFWLGRRNREIASGK